jgi:hypothetical protein
MSKSLYFLLGDGKEENKNPIGEKKENMAKQEDKVQGEALAGEFVGLEVSKSSEEVGFEAVQMLIEERIIQVSGHLFKYDSGKDQNLLVAKDCFLSIDRKSGGLRHCYMFHVTD